MGEKRLFPGREVKILPPLHESDVCHFTGMTGVIVDRRGLGWSVKVRERGMQSFMFSAERLEPIPAPAEAVADMVKHPAHYKLDLRGVEHDVWEVIEAVVEDMEGVPAYHVGSVLKYVLRSNKKGRMLEDLKKARQHLEKLIDALS